MDRVPSGTDAYRVNESLSLRPSAAVCGIGIDPKLCCATLHGLFDRIPADPCCGFLQRCCNRSRTRAAPQCAVDLHR